MRYAIDIIYIMAGSFGIYVSGVNALGCAKQDHLAGALAFALVLLACMGLVMAALDEIRYSFLNFDKEE